MSRKIIKVCKRHFACNGTVVEHPEYGEVIQFQGKFSMFWIEPYPTHVVIQ